MLGDYRIERVDEGGVNYVLLHIGYIMYPDKFKVTKALDEWVYPAPKKEKVWLIFEKWATIRTHGGWNFSTKGGIRWNISMVRERTLPKRILLYGSMCKRSYYL